MKSVSIQNVGKRFQLGVTHSTSVRDLVNRSLGNLKRTLVGTSHQENSDDVSPSEFWALKDVSFDVEPGEIIGIVGHNGAGKSTLLKILSRITWPTEGRILMNGRVASLLEVGTGFHQELTGRENIFLNGAILGMSKQEIRAKLDQIIEFSECSKFIDTPVKRYSSGMFVRLAFAVAAHLDPEIMIVDEVLAVGDIAFQKKCLGRMSEITSEGRTVLFVSHNLGMVGRICNRVVIMNRGQVERQGETHEMLMHYQGMNEEVHTSDSPLRRLNVPPQTESGATLVAVSAIDSNGSPLDEIRSCEPLRIRLSVETEQVGELTGFDLGIETSDGIKLTTLCSHLMLGQEFLPKEKSFSVDLVIDELPLAAGEYRLSLKVTKPGTAVLYDNPQVADFTVSPNDIYGTSYPPTVPLATLALKGGWIVP